MSEYPISFPWSFGGDPLLTEGDVDTDGSSFDYERRVSVCEDGLALLLGQFSTKPRIRAVTCALLDAVQDWTDAVWQVNTLRWIDTANGVQLDEIGSILVYPRAGRLDPPYRQLLRARAYVIVSDGAWQALVAVLVAAGVTPTAIAYEASYPAGFIARVTETLPDGITVRDLFEHLEAARATAIRMNFVAPTNTEARTFRWSDEADFPLTSARGFGDVENPGDGGTFATVYASSAGE